MLKEPAMLTTDDNPYNPFTQYRAWYDFDVRYGYHTCALLARTAVTNDVVPDLGVQYAMDTIVRNNYSGRHVIVTESMANDLIAANFGE